MSEAASLSASYAIGHTTFESALRGICSRAVEIERALAPPPRVKKAAVSDDDDEAKDAEALATAKHLDAEKKREAAFYWVRCIARFAAAYNKIKEAKPFKDVIVSNFADFHTDALNSRLFSDDEDDVGINDGFFKLSDTFSPFGDDHATATEIASGGVSVNKGPVIYLNTKRKDLKGVCIPIGEMYRAAIKVHIAAPANNVKGKIMPTLVLLDLYSLLFHSLPESHALCDVTKTNLSDICEAAEAVGPGTGPGAAAARASIFGGNSNAMDSALSTIGGLLGNVFGGGTKDGEINTAVQNVGDIVKTIVSKIGEDPNFAPQLGEGGGASPPPFSLQNVSQFTKAIGEALQAPEIQTKLNESANIASEVMGGAFGGSNVQEVVTIGKEVALVD